MLTTRRAGCGPRWVNRCYANIPRMTQRSLDALLTATATLSLAGAIVLTWVVLNAWFA